MSILENSERLLIPISRAGAVKNFGLIGDTGGSKKKKQKKFKSWKRE